MFAPVIGAALALNTAHAERYSFSNDSSDVGFHMVATMHEVDGDCANFQGELDVGRKATHTGKVTVQTSAVTTFIDVRDERMHNYVLEIEKYPTMELDIKAIEGDVEGLDSKKGSGEILLKGQLTIRTVSKDVEFPVTYSWSESGDLSLKGGYETKWTNWNLPDPSILISTLYAELDVRVFVTAKKSP